MSGWPRRRRCVVAGRAAAASVVVLAGCATTTAPTTQVPVVEPEVAAPFPADGWPGPGNTGVPAGTILTPSGGLYLDTPGEVVDGLLVRGCVVVAATDVTIRNSRIQCYSTEQDRAVLPERGAPTTGLTIQDTEIDGHGSVDIGVDISGVTLIRVDIHHFNDGVRMGSGVTVLDSWIHDMTRIGDLHADAIQGISARDVVIRGNRLDPTNTETGDLNNAAIQLGSETGRRESSNVVIEGNLLDGGNYSLNISGSITADDIVVRDNAFGDGSRYGPVIAPSDPQIAVTGDNEMLDARGTFDVDRP